jgi:crotonobetaine/carnitine-CoA ligase
LRRGVAETEARIVDEHDMEVTVGTTGELMVRTSVPWTISPGYFGMPDTAISCWRNGWFHTGDAFRCDEDGYYYFVDRFKDTIRRRGENISSFEVETEVNSHPDVLESAAIPVPSEWGEDEIKVLIVLKPNSSLTEETLVNFLVDRAPRFMIPRYVEIVEDLPKTEVTQRIRKFELRENALNDRTWDREKNSTYALRPPTSYEGRTANEEDE